LDLGADISLYSTTKHIEGHSTALGGAVVSRDEEFLRRLRFIRKSTGAIQTPFNAWLTLRGIQTLPLRLKQHSENALEVAKWLSQHEGVRLVNYPGLESHPQHALAVTQHRNYRGKVGQSDALHGGVVSFEVVGGVEAGRAVLNNVKLCSLVEHIGSVQTLITHPATMTHGDVPREQREAVGISDGLIRLSVGIEPAEEIIADLKQAIAASQNVQVSSRALSQGGAACPALV
jgi:cystathionine beta-lyase/cystathionine gamma-synthase